MDQNTDEKVERFLIHLADCFGEAVTGGSLHQDELSVYTNRDFEGSDYQRLKTKCAVPFPI